MLRQSGHEFLERVSNFHPPYVVEHARILRRGFVLERYHSQFVVSKKGVFTSFDPPGAVSSEASTVIVWCSCWLPCCSFLAVTDTATVPTNTRLRRISSEERWYSRKLWQRFPGNAFQNPIGRSTGVVQSQPNFNGFPVVGTPATLNPCNTSFSGSLYVCPTLSGLGITNKTIGSPRQNQMSLAI